MSDLTTRLEGAESFDAELWREVIALANGRAWLTKPEYIAVCGTLHHANMFGHSVANHLMLAVAAAMVPEGCVFQLFQKPDNRSFARIIRTDGHAVLAYEGEDRDKWPHIPANALASASIKAREQIGRE